MSIMSISDVKSHRRIRGGLAAWFQRAPAKAAARARERGERAALATEIGVLRHMESLLPNRMEIYDSPIRGEVRMASMVRSNPALEAL